MANQRQHPDPSGFTAENEIDLVLGNANPNPARVGCPPRDVLIAVARRERPADDPVHRHLIKCSPCYREVRALQQAAGERRVIAGQLRMWWAAAAAAVLVVGIVGSWVLFSRPGGIATPSRERSVSSNPAAMSAQLDLRKYTVMRGDERQAEPEPISLPRGRLNLTLLLPVGSEPGQYDVQVLDSNLASKASTTGDAEIREYITTLDAMLDVGALSPGAYQLALRRHGEDWRLFPLRLTNQ
jgi:hypothetical protein